MFKTVSSPLSLSFCDDRLSKTKGVENGPKTVQDARLSGSSFLDVVLFRHNKANAIAGTVRDVVTSSHQLHFQM